MLLAIIDTMRLHRVFCKNGPASSSLYKFYFLAIMVATGRLIQEMGLFLSLLEDSRAPSDYNYNFGFYMATFSIILIALSQITTIVTATLRTRFVNKCMVSGEQQNQRTLDLTLIAINVANIVADICIVIMYIVYMIKLWQATDGDGLVDDINKVL